MGGRINEMNTFPLCANNYFVLLIVNVVILGLVSPGAKKNLWCGLTYFIKTVLRMA